MICVHRKADRRAFCRYCGLAMEFRKGLWRVKENECEERV